MKVKLILLAILLLQVLPVSAQKRKTERAYDFFRAGEYYEAIDHFKNAYSKTKDKERKNEMIFMVAECYRLTNDPRNAELWYKRAVKSPYSRPEAQYWLADALKKNGKYQQAIDEFRKYKQLVPGDTRADREIHACELAMEWLRNPESYKVEELKEVNSKDADFSPAYARDDYGVIYFTTSREGTQGKKTHGATGQNFTDIFETRLDKKGKWSLPVPVETLNSEFEDGAASFSSDFKEIYFTRCEAGKREKKGCVIMYSTQKGEKWNDPKNIGILADTVIAAHPAISPTVLLSILFRISPEAMEGKISGTLPATNPPARGRAQKTPAPTSIHRAMNYFLMFVTTVYFSSLPMAT